MHLKSNLKAVFIPMRTIPKHAVEYGQKLAHARCKRQFLGLASSHQALIKGTYDHVMLGCELISEVVEISYVKVWGGVPFQ